MMIAHPAYQYSANNNNPAFLPVSNHATVILAAIHIVYPAVLLF
jgi:hypothetical protein